MSRIAIEQLVTAPSVLNYLNESAYDYTKWNVGAGMIAKTGVLETDNYIAPDFQVMRPMEESTAFAVNQVAAYNLSSTIAYLFGVENSTGATATRRVHCWQINRHTGEKAWVGFITLTLATATAHTVRDFKMDVKTETTGTVAVSGTAVTGTGTLFNTNSVAIGARIGFGSTDPAQITTWYRISAKASNTGATLGTSAGTISAGTPYVIQEFRPIYIATNATTTNGGIHYAKGVSIEDFLSGGTTIALASATDDQKAVYWIKDAAVQTMLAAAGAAMDTVTSTPSVLDLYVLNTPSAGNYNVYKYNLRAALTVATGASTSAWSLTTGTQAVTGTVSQNANAVYANASHGVGSGIPSMYFVTTTRFYRAALANITSGNLSWISDNISEIPTGGTSTFTATSALSTLEYLSNLDTFIIGSTHASANISYVTQYVSSGQQFQKIWSRDYKFWDQSAKDSNHPSMFTNSSTVFSYTNAGGNRVYACKQGTTALLNQIYLMSFGADWDYAASTNGRLITPEISTPNAAKFYRVFVNQVRYLGSTALGKTTEPIRLYARTANIRTDATSGWTLIDESNSLAGFAGASTIQFAIEFKTIGENCLPARVLGVNLSYEDNTDDSHYEHSVGQSNLTNKRFAYFFKTAFGGTVPTLYIRLYDAVSGALLLTDNTASATLGTFEKSTNDGGAWSAYNTTDKANDTTYIRYTPTSLADNIKVRSVISQS